MSNLVSIIIPCYNQAAYLKQSLTSVLAQTYSNWECIIVDDGSTDNSVSVIKDYARQDKRIRLLQKENGGSATARNLGMTEAKGDFMLFLDADDILDANKLEIQVALMLDKQVDMSYSAFSFINEDGKTSKTKYAELNSCTIITNWGLGSSMPPHAFMYKTSFIKANNITFDEACRYREDWNFLIDCFAANPTAATMPNYCGAYYFQNKIGKTGSYVRMQNGNFIFMAYKAQFFHGKDKLLWAYRISEELWIWMLRMIKYRNTEIAQSIHLLPATWLLSAIILMPISIWSIIVYFIKTYPVK